ncbi:MAG: RES family NAD+ phosphorylase [Pararhodobacter sp.]|nr:RES family NAD+ phosphorylase [Pararhodobacter sp.]
MRYRGPLYRALNPVWARDPLSGEGARRLGGRFNPRGTPALYTSTSIMTALREANQIGTLQPTTLVSYEADIAPIFDAEDTAALGAFDMTPEMLAADDWRARMTRDGIAPTQSLARKLIAMAFAGMRVRSFARGTGPDDINIVLWVWDAKRLVLNDSEGRLRR